MLDDLAVLEPEEVRRHRAAIVWRELQQAMGDHGVAVREHAPDVDARLRECPNDPMNASGPSGA